MATQAVIEIQGDSSGATAALEEARKAVASLDGSIEDLSDEMSDASRASSSFTAAQAQARRAAQSTAQGVSQASSALGSLSSTLGQVNPAAGAAASALSSLGGGIGSLASLANPATLAIAALGVAVTAGTAIWKRNNEELAAYNKSLEALAVATANAEADITRVGVALQSTASAFTAAANSSDELRQAFAGVRAERERLEAAETRGRLHEVGQGAAVEYSEALARLVELKREAAAAEGRAAAAEAQGYRVRVTSIRALRTQAAEALTALRDQEALVAQLKIQVTDYSESAIDLAEAERRVADTTGDGNVARERAVTNYSALADAALKAAVASQDFARINEAIASGGGLGAALVGMLDGLDVSMLEALGLDTETFSAAVDAAKSGMQSLKDLMDDMADDKRMEESLRDQSAWYERMTMSAKELAELEELDYRAALSKLEAGELLEASERRLIELRRERNSLDGASGDTGLSMDLDTEGAISRLDALNEKLMDMGTSAEGMAQAAFGTLTDSIMQSIESGEKLGDVLPAAFLKSIGSMASQMAALAAAQALMMTFTPGMQGNAAGLWGAAAALTAVAIGAGVAVKAVSKRGGGGGGADSGPPGGDRTTTYIEGVDSNRYHQSGIRARSYGADQANADRLHIDRGQAWA